MILSGNKKVVNEVRKNNQYLVETPRWVTLAGLLTH